MKSVLVCFAVAMFATAFQRPTNVSAEPPKVGDRAPAFKLPGSDGKTYKLSDLKGKKAVVIAWFPKAFTGG